MKTSLLIVSWLQDLCWLEYCLRSIEKFATGFHETVVLVPQQELEEFQDRLVSPPGIRIKTYHRVEDKAKWHLHHQAMKCHADAWCLTADFVLHIDSDCVFSAPVTPEDYFVDGKPVMLIEPYKNLVNNPWQIPTQNALKRTVEWETMRRHPQVNPIEVYLDLREHIHRLHNMTLESYILRQKADFPWGISEHNLIGAYAFESHRDAYHWIDVSKKSRPASKLIQFWSHSPPDKPQGMPNGEQGTPIKMLRELGLCPL